MNRSFQSRVFPFALTALICMLTIASALSGGFGRTFQASAAEASNALPPTVTVLPYDAETDGVVVFGQGFTPGGDVYLAIYDQMGRQLYENRWVTASYRLPAFYGGVLSDIDPEEAVFSPGGIVRESFTGLCGAAALVRALDNTTERWSGFQIVQPACASAAGPTVANGLLRPETLPMSVLNPAGATVANNLNTTAAPELNAISLTTAEGGIVVSGEGFTAGGRTYIAIYDQMGDKLYETRWSSATPAAVITGTRAEVPEAHPFTPSAGGDLFESFGGLCGAQVMVRAYDVTTAVWSNWLSVAPLCGSAPAQPVQGYGPH